MRGDAGISETPKELPEMQSGIQYLERLSEIDRFLWQTLRPRLASSNASANTGAHLRRDHRHAIRSPQRPAGETFVLFVLCGRLRSVV